MVLLFGLGGRFLLLLAWRFGLGIGLCLGCLCVLFLVVFCLVSFYHLVF